MNMLKSCGAAVCAISICLVSAGIVRAEDGEKSVKMKDLPAAVRKTVLEQSKGGKIGGLAVEVENGKTSYEAELKFKGHGKDIIIDETGAVIEVEERVEFSTLPAAVKEQFKKNAGKGRIRNVETLTRTGEPVVYEALVTTAGKKSEIQVAADGKLISVQELKSQPKEGEKEEAGERKAEKGK